MDLAALFLLGLLVGIFAERLSCHRAHAAQRRELLGILKQAQMLLPEARRPAEDGDDEWWKYGHSDEGQP